MLENKSFKRKKILEYIQQRPSCRVQHVPAPQGCQGERKVGQDPQESLKKMAKPQILININTYTNMRQQPTNAQCEETYRTLIFSAIVKN